MLRVLAQRARALGRVWRPPSFAFIPARPCTVIAVGYNLQRLRTDSGEGRVKQQRMREAVRERRLVAERARAREMDALLAVL